MAILNIVMARTTIKSTYSPDVETVQALESMARRLEITKSEALRRAIRSAASSVLAAPGREIAALEELQRSLGLSRKKAQAWARESRAERRAGSRRRESGEWSTSTPAS